MTDPKRHPWYERVTEARWFKKVDDPRTRVGVAITAVVAVVLSVVAFVQNPNTARDCERNPLRGVYNPKRLEVIKGGTCKTIVVTVRHIAKERDGDLHIQAATDAKWLRPKNYERQHGDLVVEYMPGDPYPRPHIGDRLSLVCTWAVDHQHGGWAECHPVWAVQPLGTAARKIEP